MRVVVQEGLLNLEPGQINQCRCMSSFTNFVPINAMQHDGDKLGKFIIAKSEMQTFVQSLVRHCSAVDAPDRI